MGNGKNGHKHNGIGNGNLPLWRRKEIELRQKNMLKPVGLDTGDPIPESVLKRRIYFWSWTLQKVDLTNYSKLFIFHTQRNVGFDRIYQKLHEEHPDWLITRFKMLQLHRDFYIPAPFFIAHAVEIRCTERVLWVDMILEIANLLGDIL